MEWEEGRDLRGEGEGRLPPREEGRRRRKDRVGTREEGGERDRTAEEKEVGFLPRTRRYVEGTSESPSWISKHFNQILQRIFPGARSGESPRPRPTLVRSPSRFLSKFLSFRRNDACAFEEFVRLDPGRVRFRVGKGFSFRHVTKRAPWRRHGTPRMGSKHAPRWARRCA